MTPIVLQVRFAVKERLRKILRPCRNDERAPTMRLCLRAFLLTLALTGAALADNWPAWRGRRGDGHSTETTAPLRWSRTENVRWKVPLPADGNSTPVVW